MDQVSRPLLIVAASAVILAVLWLVALKPKDPDIANTPAAPVTAIAKAKNAAAVSDAANAKLNAATGGTEAGAPAKSAATPARSAATPANSAAAPAAKPAAAKIEAAGKRDAGVVRDIRAHKVVVMLFWNAKGADDVATRGAVRDLSRHGGKVAVHVIPISRVGDYQSITQDVTINQSPTTLIIDRKGRTRSIIGFTERGELTQAVNDALAGRD